MRMRVGERLIEGQIKERAEARKVLDRFDRVVDIREVVGA